MGKKLGVLCIAVCLPAGLLADFSYEQSTKMTGGAMMGAMRIAGAFSKQLRDPVQSNVAVKGNRMLHSSKDHAQVIDLDSETITDIDFQKKTYSVMTFAEMTQAMERAMQQMKDKKAEVEKKEPETKTDVTTDFKVSVKATGATKQIAGYDTKEMLLTMTMDATDQKTGNKGSMVMNSSMWMAQKIAGYDEIHAFYKKMGAKMAWTPGAANMAAGNADMARGMAGIAREGAKLDGIPVLQVVRMTAAGDGQQAASGAGSGSGSRPSAQQSKPAETPSIGGALAGRLGGFGGFGKKKKQQEEPKQETAQATPEAAGDTSATLMEMTTEMSGFSSAALDPSKFSTPAGFKKVENEMVKRSR